MCLTYITPAIHAASYARNEPGFEGGAKTNKNYNGIHISITKTPSIGARRDAV